MDGRKSDSFVNCRELKMAKGPGRPLSRHHSITSTEPDTRAHVLSKCCSAPPIQALLNRRAARRAFGAFLEGLHSILGFALARVSPNGRLRAYRARLSTPRVEPSPAASSSIAALAAHQRGYGGRLHGHRSHRRRANSRRYAAASRFDPRRSRDPQLAMSIRRNPPFATKCRASNFSAYP